MEPDRSIAFANRKLRNRATELREQAAEIIENSRSVQVSTIKAEIQTGRTFARGALDSADPKKVARKAANARKAYETARAWAEKTAFVSPADFKEISDELRQLKAELTKIVVPSTITQSQH